MFAEHLTELVVLPVLGSDLDTVMTGLGSFSLSGTSKEEKLGLTLHQQFGIDANVNGLRIDLGQTLSASGSSKPSDRWSLVAAVDDDSYGRCGRWLADQ